MPNPNAPSSGEETGEGNNFDMGDVKDFDAHMEEVESNGSGEEVSEVEETAEIDDSGTFKHNPEAYKEMYPDAVDDVERARKMAEVGDNAESFAAAHTALAEAKLLEDDDKLEKAKTKLEDAYLDKGTILVDTVDNDVAENDVDSHIAKAAGYQREADLAEGKIGDKFAKIDELRKR